MEQMGQFIVNHWEMWSMLLLVLLFIFINELLALKKRAKSLSPEAAVALLNEDNAHVIDLRDKDTYRSGHIIHSIHASVEDFEQQRMNKYQSKTLILVCAKGEQSASLATKLRTQGFNEPLVLTGGISAWKASGLPLVKGK